LISYENTTHCKVEVWYDIYHIFIHLINLFVSLLQILEMLFEYLFMKLGPIFVNLKLTCVEVVVASIIIMLFLSMVSITGRNINDLFSVDPNVANSYNFFVPGVKCVLSLIGVFLKSKSLKFTNARRWKGPWHGPKACEKSSKLITLFAITPCLLP